MSACEGFGVGGPTYEELRRENQNLKLELQRCMESTIPRYSTKSFAGVSFSGVSFFGRFPASPLFRQFPASRSFGISVFGSFSVFVSAFQVLDYMFGERLARVGTLIGYDDWWTLKCFNCTDDVLSSGEARAHHEIRG